MSAGVGEEETLDRTLARTSHSEVGDLTPGSRAHSGP